MPQPYPGQNWRHGWIPLTPAAALNKAKKGPRPKRNPRITQAAAEAGDILRRMREQDATRARRRTVTHVVDTTPTRRSTGGPSPATPSRRTSTSAPGTGRQADQAIRAAAGRPTPAQRTTTRQAPTTPQPRTTETGRRTTQKRTATSAAAQQAQAPSQPRRAATPTSAQETASAAATPTTPDTPRPPSVERAMDDIRNVYYEIAPTNAFGRPRPVSLTELRDRLPNDLTREQVDQALARLNLEPNVFIVPESNQKILTRRDREAAVRIGGQDKHWIEIEPTGDEPTPRRQATPTAGRPPAATPTTGNPDVSRQADDAIRRAAGRTPTAQRRTEQRTAERTTAQQPAERPTQPQAPRPATQQPRQETTPTTAAPTRPSGDGAGAPVTGRLSDKPIAPNRWGVAAATGNEIVYHDDGAIGTAIRNMGGDARMDVDGEPLANVLGRLATDAVAGRKTTQEMLDAVKNIRDRLPQGSAARQELDRAIMKMDAPDTPAPQIPAGTLAPLRELAQALHRVPAVRREPDLELEPLMRLINDFAAGRTGGRRILNQVRALANKRHESIEGKAEIDRLVLNALRQLEQMQQADRRALYPPTSR